MVLGGSEAEELLTSLRAVANERCAYSEVGPAVAGIYVRGSADIVSDDGSPVGIALSAAGGCVVKLVVTRGGFRG
jgi:hypothetical protein